VLDRGSNNQTVDAKAWSVVGDRRAFARSVSSAAVGGVAAWRGHQAWAQSWRVTVSPGTVVPGDEVTIKGSGFQREQRVRIDLVRSGEVHLLARPRVRRSGKFARRVIIPEGVSIGDWSVIVAAGGRERAVPLEIEEAPPLAEPVMIGAYVAGAPYDEAKLDQFEAVIQRAPVIVSWYQAWEGSNAGFVSSLPRTVADRGAVPMITWEPWLPGRGSSQPEYRLARIVEGAFDPYIEAWATGLADFRGPVLLRFGHEMNGDWYPWGARVNGNREGDFVAAWRYLRGRFAAAGATNVRWVWSPNTLYGGATPFAKVFPGDNEVDWVALDGFNWGTSRSWTSWRSFATVFGESYREITELSGRPLMLAEVASTEGGGDKAGWIEEAFATSLPRRFPRIRAVVWFHQDKETDWRVNSSDSASLAFATGVSDPYYSATIL